MWVMCVAEDAYESLSKLISCWAVPALPQVHVVHLCMCHILCLKLMNQAHTSQLALFTGRKCPHRNRCRCPSLMECFAM